MFPGRHNTPSPPPPLRQLGRDLTNTIGNDSAHKTTQEERDFSRSPPPRALDSHNACFNVLRDHSAHHQTLLPYSTTHTYTTSSSPTPKRQKTEEAAAVVRMTRYAEPRGDGLRAGGTSPLPTMRLHDEDEDGQQQQQRRQQRRGGGGHFLTPIISSALLLGRGQKADDEAGEEEYGLCLPAAALAHSNEEWAGSDSSDELDEEIRPMVELRHAAVPLSMMSTSDFVSQDALQVLSDTFADALFGQCP